MELNEYQQAAVRTMARDLDPRIEMATLALGMAGESGEVADIVKKLIGHGHPLTEEVRQKLIKECGDVLWYVATFAALALGLTLDDIAEANIAKLQARYPEGFSSERSLNR